MEAVHVPPASDSTTEPKLEPTASHVPLTGQDTEANTEPDGWAERAVGDQAPPARVSTSGSAWSEESVTVPTATHVPLAGHETPYKAPESAPTGSVGVLADHDPDVRVSTTG